MVQSYDILSAPLEEAVAQIMPWAELFLGIFLVFGLWMNIALRALSVVVAAFIVIIVQAMVRKLPIEECGCFGELLSFPLYGTLILDGVLLTMILLLIKNEGRANVFSLDRYFSHGA